MSEKPLTCESSSDSEAEYELANEDVGKSNEIEEFDKKLEDVLSDSLGSKPVHIGSTSKEVFSEAANKPIESTEAEIVEQYTEQELVDIKQQVLELKDQGNTLYRSGDYDAMEMYSKGLDLCRTQLDDIRSVLFANRAACHFSIEQFKECEEDCTSAIDLNPTYMKVILRRAQAREKLDKLTPALDDYKKVLELDPRQVKALEAASRLPKEIHVQQEKMKEECISKLKDLGNLVLKPFGLSTDNFNMVQDPNSGGYNIQFSQDKSS